MRPEVSFSFVRSPARSWALALAVAVGESAAAGCGGSVPHPTYVAQPQAALTAVDLPPPPGRVEVMPAMPVTPPGAVWVDGEWTWRRSRWAWSPGRWVIAPRGAKFSPWVFARAPDGTLWVAPGVWRDAAGAIIEAPPPISLAQADTVEVVNASGDIETTGPTLRSRSPTGR
jgi:hypothetical protein